MIVRELLTRLGFDADNAEAKKYEASLTAVVKAGAAAVATAGALAAGATLIARNFATGAAQVENMARLANVSTTEFQRSAAAAKVFGVEQDKLADILKDTNDKIGDFMQTGAGPMADFFEKIGPKVGVTAEQFKNLSGTDALALYVKSLEEANLSQAEMVFYMEAIASDSTLLLPLFKNNAAELRSLGDAAEEAGAVIGEDALLSASELRKEFARLDIMTEGFRNTIAVALLPTVRALIGAVREWFSQNRVVIRQNLTAFVEFLADAIGLVWSGLRLLGGALDWVAQKMGGWSNTIRIVTIALGILLAMRTLRFLKELAFGFILVGKAVGGLTGLLKILRVAMLSIPLIAIVAGLALIVDELWNWYRGNETVIGSVLGTWESFRDKLMGWWGDITGAIDDALEKLRSFNAFIAKGIPDWLLNILPGGAQYIEPSQMASQAVGGLTNSNTTNANVNVMLQVPMGTPEAQGNFVKEVANREIQKALDQAIRGAAVNFTVAE